MDAALEAEARIALEDANAALQAGEWPVARQRFEEAHEMGQSPEALLGLAEAHWWLGETGASIRHLERAYAAFRRRPDPAQAVLAAVSLCLTYSTSLGNHAAARG